MGKKYGYIRVSTQGQAQNGNGLKSQREAVVNRGAEAVFEDVWTGTKSDRPKLSKLMDLLKCGDTLIVTKLDRIARSVVDGCTLIETLVNRGVAIDVLDMAVFDSRRTSVLQLHVLLAFAQFERDLLQERLQEGKAVAREKEGYREGRKPKWGIKQYNHAMNLLQNHSYKEVAEITGIPIPTLKVERRRRKDAESRRKLSTGQSRKMKPKRRLFRQKRISNKP